MVDVRKVTKRYEGKRAVYALRGVSFKVAKGEMVATMGPSRSIEVKGALRGSETSGPRSAARKSKSLSASYLNGEKDWRLLEKQKILICCAWANC